MAHFAEINSNNEVLQVISVSNDVLLDSNGTEVEQQGIDFCAELLGGTWVQASYNAGFRKNFASKGYTFDTERDAFIPPKPHNSWVLDEETCNWAAPVTHASDGEHYFWDEGNQRWVLDED
mgnify:FL=1